MIPLPRRPVPDSPVRRPRFTEGLVAGALIGAAIAGSTLWSKLRRSRSIRLSLPPAIVQPDEDAAPG